MSDDPQQPVIDFLGDPATHGGAPVKRIDTHAASVFLAGDRAIKIKRAVRFPFLDFSTLKKRRTACEAEMAVNRAFAPSIYRGAVPITRQPNGRLAIGGKGEPVEWVVEMRRFRRQQDARSPGRSGQIDDALAEFARPHGRGCAPDGADGNQHAFRRGDCRHHRAERGRARSPAGFMFVAGAAHARHGDARGIRPRATIADHPRARRSGAPMPRRPAPRQYRPDRRRPVLFDAIEFDERSPPATCFTTSPFC